MPAKVKPLPVVADTVYAATGLKQYALLPSAEVVTIGIARVDGKFNLSIRKIKDYASVLIFDKSYEDLKDALLAITEFRLSKETEGFIFVGFFVSVESRLAAEEIGLNIEWNQHAG